MFYNSFISLFLCYSLIHYCFNDAKLNKMEQK